MNYNVAVYIIFLTVVIFIIVYVGRQFYSNGRVFIVALFGENVSLADHINRLLLIAYYLFNIGYSFLKLKQWQKISTPDMLFSSLASNLALLVFILAITHYVNMFLIYQLSKSKSISITHKSFQP